MKNSILELAQHWDIGRVIDVEEKSNSSYKLKCDDTDYFLKFSDNADNIAEEERLLLHLQKNNIPVSVPLRTKNNCLYVQLDKYYFLYEYISGNHIICKTIDEYCSAAKIYGTILGRFHKALNTYKNESANIKQMDLNKQVFEWALPFIEKQETYVNLICDIKNIKFEMREVFNNLPLQFIHRDFHEDNLVFDGNKLIGIIDFELFMMGHKVYDIGYILTSILMNNVFNEEYKINWLMLYPIIIKSYISEYELSDLELKSLWHVQLASQLTFIAYAMHVNNENLLKENVEGFNWIYKNRKSIIKSIVKS